MVYKIRNKIERELAAFIPDMDRLYGLSRISPLLYRGMKDFVLRDGKRIRPLLFVIGYLGFARNEARGLYRSAVALELLHDFMLIHDDIIDKSATRRGKPSMHALLDSYLKGRRHLKFSGEDLAIVVGDVMYALAIHAFLSIAEDPTRKEAALKKFVEAAMHTGGGEFIELLCSLKDFKSIQKKDIYKIYDFKTASYSFASPLATGAILAGAHPAQVERVFRYGICLGRAFQIKDDIISLFDEEKTTGKPSLTDLQEGKKTLIVWHAYHHSPYKQRRAIERILSKKKVSRGDLRRMRTILVSSGSLKYARRQISALLEEAERMGKTCGLRPEYTDALSRYLRQLLNL